MKHCSNCGERIVGEQQFCRSCGAAFVVEGDGSGFSFRKVIIAGLFATLAGALMVLIGGFLGSNTVAFIGSVFALLAFGVMLVGAIVGDGQRRRRKITVDSTVLQYEQPVLDKADTTNRLPPIAAADHFPASVTENTTTKLRRE